MENKLPNLSKFYGDPDWVLVENIFLDMLKSLSYAPDSSTNPTDFKAQVLANKKLRDAVLNFLAQAKVINQEVTKINPWE